MPKPWVKFTMQVRYVDREGMAHDSSPTMWARSEKEARSRFLYKKCANDVNRRAQYHVSFPKPAQLELGIKKEEG